MLEDTSVRLRILSPTIDNQISETVRATISDSAVEFANTSDYDLAGDDYRITPASVDIDNSRVTYTVEATYSGTFRDSGEDDAFNGYELRFSELRNNADVSIRDAKVLSGGNTLDLTQDRVEFTSSKLFVNIAGLAFDPEDSYSVQLGYRIKGGEGDDSLTGDAGRDLIQGGAGNDTIVAEAGNDRLVGGVGADILTGGVGKDRFVFNDTGESTVASSGRDTITDFTHNRDKIDLRHMDADEGTARDQKFTFISDDAFSREAGELRAVDRSSGTYVQGDTDGDGRADFSIKLDGHFDLVAKDFLL